MTKVRPRGEAVRRHIVENLADHPRDICRHTMDRFAISRQAVNRHLRNLVAEGSLLCEGRTQARTYRLAPISTWRATYSLVPGPSESDLWTRDIRPRLGPLPENALRIWQWGFTEMMNNAIDHSEGSVVVVVLSKTAASVRVEIHDDGVGIFKKIRAALGLVDERHAVLELAKGKFTTDPKRHSGQGIFFTSRMFDDFAILSGDVYFSHREDSESDYIADDARFEGGTSVFMTLNTHTSRTPQKVFDKYTDDDFGFTKTIVPVRLAKYGDDNLVSRSQARRLLSRVEKFRTVLLDFSGVDSIGQAFADEAFRVFPGQHPEIHLMELRANTNVRRTIAQVRASLSGPGEPTTTFTAP